MSEYPYFRKELLKKQIDEAIDSKIAEEVKKAYEYNVVKNSDGTYAMTITFKNHSSEPVIVTEFSA